jgi:hypothetical protein
MKKLLLALCLLIFFCANAFAVGTVAVTPAIVGNGYNMETLTFTCVDDSNGAGIPDTTTNAAITKFISSWYLFKVNIVGGTTGPTAGSNIYINDASGIDLLGGNGVAQMPGNSAKASLFCSVNSLPALQPITGALTLHVTSDIVHSGTYTVTLILVK